MRLGYALFALIAPLAVVGELRHSGRRSHHDIAKRADASIQLHKRGIFSKARWTFYDVGGAAGACGSFNTPDQHIVALNSQQYGGGYPGPMCGKTISMTYNGRTTTARVTDECPTCPYKGLDLTRGLFQYFDTLDAGVLYGEWYFTDDGPPAPKPSPKPSPKPETTHKPPPPPPTTHHTTSTTHASPKTSSTHHSSSHSSVHSSTESSTHSAVSSASSSRVSSAVSSSAASPTDVISAGNAPGHNIADCNQALLDMGNLIIAGTKA